MEDRPESSVAAADRRLSALFPEEHGGRRRRSAFVAVAVVVVGVVVALVATDAFGSSDPGYRTGTAARRTVETTVHGVGTIEPVEQTKVAFPVAGTVASVLVVVGQSVVVGQTLAVLDGRQLETNLHEKELALAQAELALTNARNGTASGPAATGSAGGSGATRASTTAKVSGAPTLVLTAAPVGGAGSTAAAQQTVLDAQQQVDAALASAATAEHAAQVTCAAAGVTVPGSPTSATTSTSTTTTPSTAALAACQSALGALMHAQQNVTAAQHTLTRAEHELDALLAQQGSGSGSGGSAFGTGGSTFGAGGSATGRTNATAGPSAADLASYQRAVDSAAAAVAVAQQAVQQGTIVSPIAGTVTAVNLAVGQSVTAASTTDDVIVTGPGGFEVSTSLGVSEMPHVALGDAATVVPDGDHRVYRGTVVSISALPSSVTSTATDYLVVVGLADPNAALTNGNLGSVTIVTERVTDTLSIPTSAVTTVGARHLVQLLGPGRNPHTVAVSVGTLGASWTQVTSGLRAGDRVVIADLATPLPGTATSSENGTTGAAASRIQGLFRGTGAAGGFGGPPGGGAGGFGGAGR